MLGIWNEYSSIFLIAFATLILVAFTLPMLFAPLRWAQVLLWRIPDHTDLAVYFGRSLGVAGTGIAFMCLLASQHSIVQPIVYDGLIAISAIFTVTHIHGAVRKIQPITETLEIGFWFGLMLLQIAVYPSGSGVGFFG
jgi:hypothetical protein